MDAVADVMERCNRQLAVVTDGVDLKHSLPKYKLLTRRKIFSRFCTEGMSCLLFPKITTRLHISVSLNLPVLPRSFPQGIHSTKSSDTRLTSWPTTNLALIILFQVMAHSWLPSSWCHLALGYLLIHNDLFLNRQCKWFLAMLSVK